MARRFPNSLGSFLAGSATVNAMPLTFSAWIKPTDGADMIVYWYGVQGVVQNAFYAEIFSGSLFVQSVENDTFANANVAGVVSGQWNHIAGVYASATSRIAYVNGVGGTENTTS